MAKRTEWRAAQSLQAEEPMGMPLEECDGKRMEPKGQAQSERKSADVEAEFEGRMGAKSQGADSK